MTTDTTWKQIYSPYILDGPILITSGVTLTVEAGVTVHLNDYYIQVNGTFVAVGTTTNPIYFDSGGITFTAASISWNEQTEKGSIIENAIFSSSSNNAIIAIKNSSTKIANNVNVSTIDIDGGSPIILGQKNFPDIQVEAGTPQIEGNEIWVLSIGGSPIISSNIINYGVRTNPYADSSEGSPIINNNTISLAAGGWNGGAAINLGFEKGTMVISNNNITGLIAPEVGRLEGPLYTSYGIVVAGNALISNNVISGCTVSSVKLIGGIGTPNVQIQNNTLSGPGIIVDEEAHVTIKQNNIEGGVNLTVNAPNDVDASQNWWGTTDQQTISRMIHDFKNDFNLGNVTFIPFLTAPNLQAIPDYNASIPTVIPTSTPAVPEFSWLTILPLLLAIPIALIIAKKTTKQSLTMKESSRNSD